MVPVSTLKLSPAHQISPWDAGSIIDFVTSLLFAGLLPGPQSNEKLYLFQIILQVS